MSRLGGGAPPLVEVRLEHSVAELDKRIAAAMRGAESARGAVPYQGVFRDGHTYLPGQFATYGGSLWHCDAETSERPGSSDAWTLAVKRGADGKDAK